MIVERATAADRPAIDALWHQPLADELLVVRDAGTVVAFCNYRVVIDDIEILAIATRPDHRRRGLGRLLLERVAQTPGAARILLEVRRSNAAAIALYERAGFSTIHVRRGYYQDTSEDALVMSKPLP